MPPALMSAPPVSYVIPCKMCKVVSIMSMWRVVTLHGAVRRLLKKTPLNCAFRCDHFYFPYYVHKQKKTFPSEDWRCCQNWSWFLQYLDNFGHIQWCARKMSTEWCHEISVGTPWGLSQQINSWDTLAICWDIKGATSQEAESPAVLDQTVIVLGRTVIVLHRHVIVLDRTVIKMYGVLSFPSARRWVRPSLVTSHYETHQHTSPPNSLLSHWWQICL